MSDTRAFFVRINKDRTDLAAECLASGRVYLVLPGIEGVNLSAYTDRSALRMAVYGDCDDDDTQLPAGAEWDLAQMEIYATEIRAGDLIVFRHKHGDSLVTSVGRATRPYTYHPAEQADRRHVISVKWELLHVPDSSYGQDVVRSFSSPRNVTRLDAPAHIVRRLNAMIRQGGTQPQDPRYRFSEAEGSEVSPGKDDLWTLARQELLHHLRHEYGPHGFAGLVGEVLTAGGWEVSVSQPGPDGGVDIHAIRAGEQLQVAVRARRSKFTASDIQEFISRLDPDKPHIRALFVSLEGFSEKLTWKSKHGCFAKASLWSGMDFIDRLCAVYDKLPRRTQLRIPLETCHVLVRLKTDTEEDAS